MKKACLTIVLWLLLLTIATGLISSPSSAKAEELQANCSRLVSLAPSITAVLESLKLSPQIIAVTRFDHILKNPNLTLLGGYLDLKLTAVLQLEPTLVLGLPEHAQQLSIMKRAGVPTIILNHNRLEGYLNSLQEIGKICHKEVVANYFTKQVLAHLEDLTQRRKNSAALLKQQQALTLVTYAGEDIEQAFAVGSNAFLSDLLPYFSVKNWLQGNSRLLSEVKHSALISNPPDLVLVINIIAQSSSRTSETQISQQLQALPGMGRAKILFLRDPGFIIPGYRLEFVLSELGQQFFINTEEDKHVAN